MQSDKTDDALKDLAERQTIAGDIEAAKATASQITYFNYRRQVWMGILYKQFNELNDLRGVKETVLSLTDSRLWDGSWVHDLVLRTAQSGDIDGARTFVRILPKDSPRGHYAMLIVFVQAKQGDYSGADATLELLEPDNPSCDIALLLIVKAMADRSDLAMTLPIVDRELRAKALNLVPLRTHLIAPHTAIPAHAKQNVRVFAPRGPRSSGRLGLFAGSK